MSNSPELATYILYTSLGAGANVLVDCIGIVAAIIFWRRSPKAAIFCIVSLILLLLIQVSTPLLIGFATRTVTEANQMGIAIARLNVVTNFIHAIAVGIMIVAVLIDRRQNRSSQ